MAYITMESIGNSFSRYVRIRRDSFPKHKKGAKMTQSKVKMIALQSLHRPQHICHKRGEQRSALQRILQQ